MKYVGAGTAITDGSRILLLQRADNRTWCLPGGHPKEGETPLETARRETKEESGFLPNGKPEVCVSSPNTFRTCVFVIDDTFECKLSSEHLASKWVSLDRVRNLNLYKPLRENWTDLLNAILKKIRKQESFAEWISRQ